MNIEIFNFLEDHTDQIVSLLQNKIPKDIPAYKKIPRQDLKKMLENILDGYIDLLVTGQTEALDKVFKYMARLHSSKNFQVSDILLAILSYPKVIRRLLLEEYAEREDGIRNFNDVLEKTDDTAHKAAGAFVNIYQEHIAKKMEEHNSYLEEAQSKFGIDLSKFIIFRA